MNNIKHLFLSFLKVNCKDIIQDGGIPTKWYVGLPSWLCFMVNLVSFAVLMMCREHRRHCCSQSFCFSFIAICSFSVLVIKTLSIYKLLLCILCMLCNFALFLVIDLEYILILINSYRGTIPSVVRLYFSCECFGCRHGKLASDKWEHRSLHCWVNLEWGQKCQFK